MLTRALTASALAGVATGGRSLTPVAALAPSTRARRGLSVLAVGELVADKLPSAPSRLAPPGLLARLALGGVCGAVVARRSAEVAPVGDADPRVLTAVCTLVGVASAVAGSQAGARWRSWCHGKTHTDRPGAVAEDFAVLGLAAAAARLVAS